MAAGIDCDDAETACQERCQDGEAAGVVPHAVREDERVGRRITPLEDIQAYADGGNSGRAFRWNGTGKFGFGHKQEDTR